MGIETPQVGARCRQLLHVLAARAHQERRQLIERVHGERRAGEQQSERQQHQQHDRDRRIEQQVIGQ